MPYNAQHTTRPSLRRHRHRANAYPGASHLRRAKPHRRDLVAGGVIAAIWLAAIAIGLTAPHDATPVYTDILPADHPGYASDAVPGCAGILPASDAVASSSVPLTTADAFRACATKALAGDFGTLKPWQRNAYQRGLTGTISVDRVRLTIYGPWDGYAFEEGTAYGIGCTLECAASNTLTAYTVIWIPEPAHLRAIGDTGAAWNDPKAQAEGCDYWIDLWVPYRGWRGLQNTVYHRDIVVIGGR